MPGRAGGLISRMFGSAVSGAAGTAAGGATVAVLQPILQEEVNTVNSQFPFRPLSAADAAAAVERDAMSYAEAEAEAKLTGYNPGRFRVLEKLAGIPPNSEQLIQMVRRGVITAARMREGLIQGNVRSEWADDLIKITDAVPSVSQMVHFATRGVYGGGTEIEGTKDEMPAGYLDDTKRDGLQAEDATKYWQAHWRLPSPEQLFRMFHRGIINGDELDRSIKANDFPPFWRPRLRDIAYLVPGRIDLRRMYAEGIIDEARVLKGYKDIGYNDQDAQILTRFAVELAHKTTAAGAATVDWVGRGRGMAFTDVHGHHKKGDVSDATATAQLEAIGVPAAQAAAVVGFWKAAQPPPGPSTTTP